MTAVVALGVIGTQIWNWTWPTSSLNSSTGHGSTAEPGAVASQVGVILLRPVDLALFALMAYCSIALNLRSRQFARTYDLSVTGRRLGYWAITAYVTLSLPGHAMFLLTGDTRFFDAFPWWFSLVIMPVHVLVVGYVLTLHRRPLSAPGPNAGRL